MTFQLSKDELLEVFPTGAPRNAVFYWETLGKPSGKAAVLDLLREKLPERVAPGERSPDGARRSALLALRACFARDANSQRDSANDGIARLAAQFKDIVPELSVLIGKTKGKNQK